MTQRSKVENTVAVLNILFSDEGYSIIFKGGKETKKPVPNWVSDVFDITTSSFYLSLAHLYRNAKKGLSFQRMKFFKIFF